MVSRKYPPIEWPPLRSLEDRVAALESATGRVAGYFTGSTTAVGTTDTTLVTGSIEIPADWNGYELVGHWAARFIDSSGGNTGITTVVTAWVELDGTVIASTQSGKVTDLNTSDVTPMSGPAWSTGLLATGSRTVELVASRVGAPTVDALGIRLMVEAWRTS